MTQTQHDKSKSGKRNVKVNRSNVTTVGTEDSVEDQDNDDFRPWSLSPSIVSDMEEEFEEEWEDDIIDIPCFRIVITKTKISE